MPNYEYQCNSCNEEFELRRKRKDPSPVICPACGKNDCERLISASAFHLKGGGWFDEGYGSTQTTSKKKASGSEEKSESSTSESKSESKPAKDSSATKKVETKTTKSKKNDD